MAESDSATRVLGRYELLQPLGQGGMGEVHLARSHGAAGFEKLFIVKTILPRQGKDPQFVERFLHEARVLVHLTHSNIAQVFDMGEADGQFFMCIEYVAGVDLACLEGQAWSAGGQIPIPVAVQAGQKVAEALGYAHRKTGPDGSPLGIVHRDVSPQNVMVSYEGEVKVIDFGLAKSAAGSHRTQSATVLGKLGYLSPEQARAERVDYRSDIYSCGIVVWELLAGRQLFEAGSPGEMLARMANPRLPSLTELRPDVSPDLVRVVERALAPDPAERYTRADDFARALNERAIRDGLQIGADELGGYVRERCATEFADHRKLISRLSSMTRPEAAPSQIGFEPTAIRRTPPPEPFLEATAIRRPAVPTGGAAPLAGAAPLPGAEPARPQTAIFGGGAPAASSSAGNAGPAIAGPAQGGSTAGASAFAAPRAPEIVDARPVSDPALAGRAAPMGTPHLVIKGGKAGAVVGIVAVLAVVLGAFVMGGLYFRAKARERRETRRLSTPISRSVAPRPATGADPEAPTVEERPAVTPDVDPTEEAENEDEPSAEEAPTRRIRRRHGAKWERRHQAVAASLTSPGVPKGRGGARTGTTTAASTSAPAGTASGSPGSVPPNPGQPAVSASAAPGTPAAPAPAAPAYVPPLTVTARLDGGKITLQNLDEMAWTDCSLRLPDTREAKLARLNSYATTDLDLDDFHAKGQTPDVPLDVLSIRCKQGAGRTVLRAK